MATRASHIDPKVGTGEEELVPNRNGYGEGLLEAGKRDERVVALCADLTESTRTHLFAEEFPARFVQVGIAEQNLASTASGMAAMGKIPFFSSYAAFSPGRNWEQIRTTIAYNNSNAKVIGAHAGVSVGPDGATHQMTEDIALMRAMPNMVVIAPADVHEARKATLAAAQFDGPVYIRVGRSAVPTVTTETSPFTIGKAEVMLKKGDGFETSVGIVVTGSLLHAAIVAAEQLEAEKKIGASVLHMPTIKPLDEEALVAFAKEHDVLITLEEHQITGGLGGAVTECLSLHHPMKIKRLGVNDVFGQSGEPNELLAHYGLDAASVAKAAAELF